MRVYCTALLCFMPISQKPHVSYIMTCGEVTANEGHGRSNLLRPYLSSKQLWTERGFGFGFEVTLIWGGHIPTGRRCGSPRRVTERGRGLKRREGGGEGSQKTEKGISISIGKASEARKQTQAETKAEKMIGQVQAASRYRRVPSRNVVPR